MADVLNPFRWFKTEALLKLDSAALLKEVNEMGEQKCSEKDSKDLIQNKIKIIEIMSTVRRTSSV